MNTLLKLWNMLDGYKTYIVAFVMAALNLCVALGLVSPDHLTQINVVLTALGLGALRSGIKKV